MKKDFIRCAGDLAKPKIRDKEALFKLTTLIIGWQLAKCPFLIIFPQNQYLFKSDTFLIIWRKNSFCLEINLSLTSTVHLRIVSFHTEWVKFTCFKISNSLEYHISVPFGLEARLESAIWIPQILFSNYVFTQMQIILMEMVLQLLTKT
jgi:hypothetical protein